MESSSSCECPRREPACYFLPLLTTPLAEIIDDTRECCRHSCSRHVQMFAAKTIMYFTHTTLSRHQWDPHLPGISQMVGDNLGCFTRCWGGSGFALCRSRHKLLPHLSQVWTQIPPVSSLRLPTVPCFTTEAPFSYTLPGTIDRLMLKLALQSVLLRITDKSTRQSVAALFRPCLHHAGLLPPA